MAFQAKLLSHYDFHSHTVWLWNFPKCCSTSALCKLFWDEYCFNYKQKATVKAPHFNFWTKRVLIVSVSDTRDIAFYRCYSLKGPILNAGPSANFLIVDHPKGDHNEREFKRLIVGRILDQLEKSFKTREASCKLSTIKYNIIKTWPSQNIIWNNSSIQIGPLARIEKQAVP